MVDFFEYDANSVATNQSPLHHNMLSDASLTRGFGGNPLKDVIHERIKNGHRLVGNTGIGMDLLQDY